MAGRNHHSNSSKRREIPNDDHRISSRIHQTILLEDRISSHHREIQTLLSDNQRLAATHVALEQELAATEQELRHLSSAAAQVKAERDDEVREVYEKSLKLDSEVMAMDAMMAELVQVRANVQKLKVVKQELTVELEAVRANFAKSSSDSKHFPSIKAEIDSMLHEIQRGRAAIEFEKRTHASNLEQSHAREKGMIAMSQEVEKLHAELANAEKRARAAAAITNPFPSYAPTYGHPDVVYGGSAYPDPYGMHQFQGGVGADIASQYAAAAHVPATHGPYNVQPAQTHMQ